MAKQNLFKKLKDLFEFLFYETLNIQFFLTPWVRSLCKFGDLFLLNDIREGIGVCNVFPIPVNEIEREEGFDQNNPASVRFRWQTSGNRILEDFEIAHFRLLGDDSNLPYGASVLSGARRIWRMLCLKGTTKVWTTTGYKEIKNIVPGDEVYSFDYSKKEIKKTKVKNSICSGEDVVYRIKTAHKELFATADHPIMVSDGSYKKVCELTTNDWVILPKVYNKNPNIPDFNIVISDENIKSIGNDINIGKIFQIEKIGKEEVYDIEIDDELHNFIAEGIVVSNCHIEDNMMLYRIVRCLHGDTKIRTETGHKQIKNLKIGDTVYSYNIKKNKNELTTITDWVNNGKQQIWEIKSQHRSIKANSNHPILVKDKKTNIVEYVKVQDLIPKRHQFIMPILTNEDKIIPIELNENKYEWFGSLSKEGIEFFKKIKFKKSVRQLSKEFESEYKCGNGRICQFLYVKNKIKGLPWNTALKVCEKFSIPYKFLIKYPKGMFNLERLNIPKFVDEEFAKFFGFMIGDGFMSKNLHSIGFATGIKEEINQYYANILKKYCSTTKFHQDKRNSNPVIGKFYCNSFLFCNLMKDLGFTSSVYTKKIPEWVFQLPNNMKEAFIDGLVDADGHRRIIRKTKSMEIDLANENILTGIKEICHQLGWNVSSKVGKRYRKGKRIINGSRMKKEILTSYSLYLTKKKTGLYENIISVKPTNEYNDVYDIRVESENHNFIADGVVVHNSPERRVFYIDTGNIAPEKVPDYMEEVKRTMTTNPVINKDNGEIDLRHNTLTSLQDYYLPIKDGSQTRIETLPGGQHATDIDDVEYLLNKLFAALKIPKAFLSYEGDLCLHPNTKIPLLDGRTLTIKEIAEEYENGTQNWVYSSELEGSIKPGKILWAGKTKICNKLLEITLDNNEKILCTENHPFLLRTGEYKRADELICNDSIMPLYRKLSNIKEKDFSDGYEKVFNNSTNKWIYTHRMVANNEQINIHESAGTDIYDVIHHNTFNKLKNYPEHLTLMGKSSHIKLHAELADNLLKEENRRKLIKIQKTKKYKQNLSAGTKKAWDNDDGQRREKLIECNKKYKKIEKMSENFSKLCKEGILDFGREKNPTWKPRPRFEDLVRLVKNGTFKKFEIRDILNCSLNGIDEILSSNGFNSWYDFVSKYDKIRKGRIIKSIDLEHAASIATVSKNKLDFYKKIGISRCGFENYFRRNNLDLFKWFDDNLNTINHIQKTVISELNKIASIHLIAHGFADEEILNFDLKLSNPSTLAEQQKLELLRSKFEIISTPEPGYFSRDWLRRKVMGLTQDEMEDIDVPGGEGGGGGGFGAPGCGIGAEFGDDDLGMTPTSDETGGGLEDRKSTRLNSSHSQISYAVFCLKIRTAVT